MALIGISLILASLVYVAIRRPPLMETLLALWRGQPKIEQPPTSPPAPPPPSIAVGGEGEAAAATPNNKVSVPIIKSTDEEKEKSARDDDDETTPQTTPKASATQLTDSGVPTFVLSPEPPASAASVER